MEPAGYGQVRPSGQSGWEDRVGPAYQIELNGKDDRSDPKIRRLKATGQIECETCKERTYQDRSNDPNVSFKAPGHISPQSAGEVVRAHEQEHVANQQASALRDGRRVISQSVRIFSSVCPECGKVYVSGGETRTVTATNTQSRQEPELGAQVDVRV
jgi:hypothetical protein